MPDLVQVEQEAQAKGARVLYVSMDLASESIVTESKLVDFMEKQGLSIHSKLVDAETDAVLDAFNLSSGLPTTLVYNSQGQLIDSLGPSNLEQFRASMQRALASN